MNRAGTGRAGATGGCVHAACVLVTLAALGCIDGTRDDLEVEACASGVRAASAPLFGGTSYAELLELSPREANGVVAVITRGTVSSLCTGALLAPSLVVTAAHCVDEAQPPEIRVGRDAERPQFGTSVRHVDPHPSRDLALLVLSNPVPIELAQSLQPLRAPLNRTGQDAQLAGFGLTEHETIGVRLFTAEEVIDEDSHFVTVDGRGERGACVGDSGGPLLVRDDGGRLRVVGVLSHGSASCVDIDRYAVLHPVMPWIDDALLAECAL